MIFQHVPAERIQKSILYLLLFIFDDNLFLFYALNFDLFSM